MKRYYDVVIVGAGIVGLSVAKELICRDSSLNILIMEKENDINKHQTGRNSGVVHSGIYYKQGTFKSSNCIQGYNLLVEFLSVNDIPFKLTGKAIIARQGDQNEINKVKELYQNGRSVGLKVELLDGKSIKKIHSQLIGDIGLWVPETGMTDFKQVARIIEYSLTQAGVTICYNCEPKHVQADKEVYTIKTMQDTFRANVVVNCAGLQSDRIYKMFTGHNSPVTIVPIKGEYYTIGSHHYASDIPVYPVPNTEFPFLGIHITPGLDGTVKLGPNAVISWSRQGYSQDYFDFWDTITNITTPGLYRAFLKYGKIALEELIKQKNKHYFANCVRQYWGQFDWSMVDGYRCGIRAQAVNGKGFVDDFIYEVSEKQIHVLNAPSPAATSSFAIAKHVAELYDKIIS